MLQDADVPVYFEHRLKDVVKDGIRITSIQIENGNTFKAKMFIDATYEGDLMAKAGVSFHVGREAQRDLRRDAQRRAVPQDATTSSCRSIRT